MGTPLFSMVLTTVSHSAPALVLTQSPRDLMPPPRDMLLTSVDTTDTTLASVMLMLLSCTLAMLDTPMPLLTELTPTLLLPPPLDSSTLPMLVSAPTTSELLFLARLFNQVRVLSSNTKQARQ